MEANIFMLVIAAIFFGFYLYFKHEDKKFQKGKDSAAQA